MGETEGRPDNPGGPGPGSDAVAPATPPATGQGPGQVKDAPLPAELHAILSSMRGKDAEANRKERETYRREMREEFEEERNQFLAEAQRDKEPDLPEETNLPMVDKIYRSTPAYQELQQEVKALRQTVADNAIVGGMSSLRDQPFADEVQGEVQELMRASPNPNRGGVEAAYRYASHPRLAAENADLKKRVDAFEVDKRNAMTAAGGSESGGTSDSGEPDFGSMDEKQLDEWLKNSGTTDRQRLESLGLAGPG